MSLLQYVNPLQGTDSTYDFSNGNTLPLVMKPFGMASWSPQTNEKGKGWFFHPNHRVFQGIRLTHQPSPWIDDYGHLVIMPQSGPLCLSASKRSSSFKPEEMSVKPDHFKISLQRYPITLELTPTDRCASMRINYRELELSRLIIAPIEGECNWKLDSDARRLTGYTRAKAAGAPDNFATYFVFEFDCEIDLANSSTFSGNEQVDNGWSKPQEALGAFIGFLPSESGIVNVRVATSFISVEQAAINLRSEVGIRSFEEVRAEASETWEKTLNRIDIEAELEDDRRTFYTCLYRVSLFPRMWYEYDEEGSQIHYSPYDGKIYPGPMYSDNGFWDTYRTTVPLFSLLYPTRLGEILQSWVNAYKEGGWMPKWVSPGERSVMPGTLIDAVFADAYVKGIQGFNIETAYEGLLKHATVNADKPALGRRGLDDYNRLGYLPCDTYHESVSNTLDYVYGDFCIAQLAKGMGKEADYEFLITRAKGYAKLFDPSVRFMRGKKEDGTWNELFDPLTWGGEFCEGGAWQSSWAVPHDLLGLANLMGGRDAFVQRLHELMNEPPVFKVGSYGFEIHEMSEMAAIDFGQFAICNQPSFHIPYIFTALGQPSSTQYWVRKAAEELFSAETDGLPGDEDNGSMCAWYLFSAMGFYPLSPGAPQYVMGSPLFQRLTLHLEDGNDLIIEASDNGTANKYVESVQMNEESHNQLFFTHEQLQSGAHIRFQMRGTPSEKTYEAEALPFSMSKI
ncbi:GH92 family glycosyl hydrolase [Cohnella abietis]|uniref:Alpha-1 2-mannosidase n=1 Tax=Cohnella abietis TaxID=2507935 RepID=A0A3T1D1H5_9BACL|nr:GH92 family glycosyl hydrolase [Cohnella abietis]BBI31946.1 alpha-1 2-mannosidase [Cohnella abietis]